MKILQLIQKKQFRGAEVFCCQLSTHLVQLGHEVEIYSIYDGNASLPFYTKKVKSLGRSRKRRFIDIGGWKKLAQVVREYKPDIIQANAADTLKYAVLSKLFYKWKTPLIYRNASASSFYIKSFFSKKVNAFLLKRVDIIISVSQSSKEDITRLFPFTRDKCLVIPVGIEERTLKIAEVLKTRDTRNIIHVGSFTKEKNHDGILSIFQKVQAIDPSVELHLLGDGILKDEIENKVKFLKLETKIHFHGEVANPFPYLKASDVLILPSLIEGLPGVILEAMYCKVPVVAYEVGGIPEILGDETGCIVPKNNETAFAETVVKVMNDSNTVRIENAYNMVRRNFSNKNLAKRFLDVYLEFLK